MGGEDEERVLQGMGQLTGGFGDEYFFIMMTGKYGKNRFVMMVHRDSMGRFLCTHPFTGFL